jgi:hypothetical protein
VVELLAQEPDVMSLEVLRRARVGGYAGGRSALYDLIAAIRPRPVQPLVRFEGVPGEFSQHDFGQVAVRFLGGRVQRVHFLTSRLRYSRWAEVTLMPNEQAETLARTLVRHFAAMGGVPLAAVFDRPTTIALAWGATARSSSGTSPFAQVMLELGVAVSLFGRGAAITRARSKHGGLPATGGPALVPRGAGSAHSLRGPRPHDRTQGQATSDVMFNSISRRRLGGATSPAMADRRRERYTSRRSAHPRAPIGQFRRLGVLW